jgi:hypothetical protein
MADPADENGGGFMGFTDRKVGIDGSSRGPMPSNGGSWL